MDLSILEFMSNPTRIALVGLGGHGRTIQDACSEASNITVSGVYDPDESEAEQAAVRFDCPIAPSYDALIRADFLDAVVLVTPNHLHRAQVESAVDVGLNVFVEKPLANTVIDGLSMIESAEAKGLVLMVGHNMRFSNAARKAKAFIDEGRLGDIVTTEIHFSSDSGRYLSEEAWRNQPELCPLLPVMQLAVHAFDLIHYLAGRIEDVITLSRSFMSKPGVVDNVTACYRLEDGSLGTMVSNYCSPTLFEYRITGTEGIMRCTFDSFLFKSRGGNVVEEEDYSDRTFDSYTKQMIAFGEAVQACFFARSRWVGGASGIGCGGSDAAIRANRAISKSALICRTGLKEHVPMIKTTVVGSYPMFDWLAALPGEQALTDATAVVLKTQELAGLDVIADGELYRFDINPPGNQWDDRLLRSSDRRDSHRSRQAGYCCISKACGDGIQAQAGWGY